MKISYELVDELVNDSLSQILLFGHLFSQLLLGKFFKLEKYFDSFIQKAVMSAIWS